MNKELEPLCVASNTLAGGGMGQLFAPREPIFHLFRTLCSTCSLRFTFLHLKQSLPRWLKVLILVELNVWRLWPHSWQLYSVPMPTTSMPIGPLTRNTWFIIQSITKASISYSSASGQAKRVYTSKLMFKELDGRKFHNIGQVKFLSNITHHANLWSARRTSSKRLLVSFLHGVDYSTLGLIEQYEKVLAYQCQGTVQSDYLSVFVPSILGHLDQISISQNRTKGQHRSA